MKFITKSMYMSPRFMSAAVFAVIVLSTAVSMARSIQFDRLSQGGLDPNIYVTSISAGGGTSTVSWAGLQGPFQVEANTNSALATNGWFAVSPLTNALSGSFTVVVRPSIGAPVWTGTAYFRLTGPELQYVSVAAGCYACHAEKVNTWSYTAHRSAFESLGTQSTNASCLPCHTVGYGYSTGYTTNRPALSGVQCENCHGPAPSHNASLSPAVTQSPKLCGGCHRGAESPQYDEWAAAGTRTYYHGRTGTNMHFVAEYASTNIATSEGRMGQCGPCHSGRVQHDLAKATPISAPNSDYILPTSNDVLEAGIGCVTCHDPHKEHAENGGYNLRYPLYSTNAGAFYTAYWTNTLIPVIGTNAYTLNRTTNYFIAYTNFMMSYKPNNMLCGQCHVERFGDPSRRLLDSPHPSYQYSFNSASVGVTDTNVPFVSNGSMAHGINDKGETCTLCHVPHLFEVETNGCYLSGCHSMTNAADTNMYAKMEATAADISNRIVYVRDMLNAWALSTNCPSAITNNHATGKTPTWWTVKWEYATRTATTPLGIISRWGIPSSITNGAPSAAQQGLIPQAIREARYNLYLCWAEESDGIHNPDWARYLIAVASNRVAAALNGPFVRRAGYSTISPTITNVVADGVSTRTITVQAKDEGGANITTGGDTVAFYTTVGTLSSTTDNNDGTYVATWTAPTSTAKRVAYVWATLNGTGVGGALGTSPYCNITLNPGAVDASHSTISPLAATNSVATGTNRTITVQARDVYNNNRTSSSGTVAFFANCGTLGTASNLNNGTYTVRWTVPPNTDTNPAVIYATLDSVLVGSAVNASNSVITLTP